MDLSVHSVLAHPVETKVNKNSCQEFKTEKEREMMMVGMMILCYAEYEKKHKSTFYICP